MVTELCTCCGHGGRGFIQAHPQVWTGCRCLGIRRCEDCSRCYEHCLCVTPEQRLEALEREEVPIRRLVDEARRLAEGLGIEEMSGKLTDDTMWKIEQELKLRYQAFRRFRRRVDRLIEIDVNRQSVEDRADAELITVESDRPN